MKTPSTKSTAMTLCAALAGSLAISGAAFALEPLSNGYGVGESETEGKCGEGKCGAEKDQHAEGEKKDAEGKCGEGKCGAEKDKEKEKDTEGKCGEGKCGESR